MKSIPIFTSRYRMVLRSMGNGTVIKAVSSFYTVITDDHQEIVCRARGKLKREDNSPVPGDRVVLSEAENGAMVLESVLPRKNYFIRPNAANLDAIVFIASEAKPVTDPYLIDKLSVITEHAGCELILCVNKTDLSDSDSLSRIYAKTPFPVICTSAVTGEGLERLRRAISGKICAFTGNSGVGKSSLLNLLHPELNLKTDEISEKLGRGKHTTRYTEFLSLPNNTFAADTPGFAAFDPSMTAQISKEDLSDYFPDFYHVTGNCRFLDCTHRKEPGCSVRAAKDNSVIAESRYASYLRLYDELAAAENRW